MERVAIVPGTFDPVTLGHTDIISRAAKLFDRVIVAVCNNSEKKCMFSPEVRLSAVQAACKNIGGVTAEICDGFLAEFAVKHGACALVKGARGESDFYYEHQLAMIISHESKGAVDTVILAPDGKLEYISSTYVRELIKYKKPLESAVPAAAIEILLSARKI